MFYTTQTKQIITKKKIEKIEKIVNSNLESNSFRKYFKKFSRS